MLEPQRGLPMMVCPPIVERRDDELERMARAIGLDNIERWEAIATALGLGDAWTTPDELVLAVQELAERSRDELAAAIRRDAGGGT